MRIYAGYDLEFKCVAPTPAFLLLQVHPSRMGDLETDDKISFSRPLFARELTDAFGNRLTKCLFPAGKTHLHSRFVINDDGLPDRQRLDACQTGVQDLPADTFQFLLGSRYCETQKLSDLAWHLFGNSGEGWRRVQAICDYVNEQISFGYQYARDDRTAFEAHEERVGVCRDFAHLAISLCRCMNIPARYCTGYLGDIGVPEDPAPMDFSAWFEVFLEGHWYAFDARHNQPRIGRIVIARGRDAADVAISTTFGAAQLVTFSVITKQVDPRANANTAAAA